MNNFLCDSQHVDLVAILLCTFNGEKFLSEQLDSLQSQTYQNWVVIASDDGSTDNTLKILQQYKAKWPSGKLSIRNGPRKGFCQNFLSLACNPDIFADYYAFCDQDDVWLPEKLDVALRNIAANQKNKAPYVYCGRSLYVDNQLNYLGISPLFVFPRSFRNALVQSIAGGNTMVFNQSTKSLIEHAGPLEVVSHDWWTYLIVTGVGGDFFYDPVPQLLYRQHAFALIGENKSFMANIKRIRLLLKGRFKDWNRQNINALKKVNYLLQKNHQEILMMFEMLREAKFKDRLRLLEICGLYRQTKGGTFKLFLAVILKKI
jgi:glycosyltransferase involved in cell wall biosynthesis